MKKKKIKRKKIKLKLANGEDYQMMRIQSLGASAKNSNASFENVRLQIKKDQNGGDEDLNLKIAASTSIDTLPTKMAN